ncbi:MAG: hypothetical protein GF346_02155 [Candidatus Eisenbacteria bacterium]|nr:hypothetical protein [Candidatus Latescibacterota bacterium]MBD3301235.1 hypothetical protein [Candidatus Eisenbacteria bacterium]
MDRSPLLNLEKLMTSRRNAIFERLLWLKDGDLFLTNPSRDQARPLSRKEITDLIAELTADPETRPILKVQSAEPRQTQR